MNVLFKRCAALLLSAAPLISACIPAKGLTDPRKTTSLTSPCYSTITEVFDWGPAVTKLVVYLGKPLPKGAADKDTFAVRVTRRDPRPNVHLAAEDAQGDCTVTNSYVSDEEGNACDGGKSITLELKFGPNLPLSMPLNYDSVYSQSNSWVDCSYAITQKKKIQTPSGGYSQLSVTTKYRDIKKLVDDFSTGKYTKNETTLTYASFAPVKDGKKKPLIVWLRGAGEKGTDPTTPIAANKSCTFAGKELQALFGGAYVLSPQCPHLWMEGTTESTLFGLIQEYAAKNGDIDTGRIYLGGGSNGGYMTLLLLRNHPDYFAAALPTCEAMPDRLLTDADIQKLKNIPIWFTAAKSDTTVPPDEYVVPTFARLQKAGAKNVHFSFFDKVTDTSGLFKKADGSPFEYDGHFSFIYVFNNQCTEQIDGKETAILPWLAAQRKSGPVPEKTSVPSAAKRASFNALPTVLILLPVLALAATGLALWHKKRKKQ